MRTRAVVLLLQNILPLVIHHGPPEGTTECVQPQTNFRHTDRQGSKPLHNFFVCDANKENLKRMRMLGLNEWSFIFEVQRK